MGVLNRRVVELKQTKEDVFYRELVRPELGQPQNETRTTSDQTEVPEKQEEQKEKKEKEKQEEEEELKSIVHDFFNFRTSVSDLHAEFARRDPFFSSLLQDNASTLTGIRVFHQDPFECLVTFLCTSNNNIGRITLMIERLCEKYGTFLGEIADDDTTPTTGATTKHRFFGFPTFEQLRNATEQELRELGFGYRAKYLVFLLKRLIVRCYIHPGVSEESTIISMNPSSDQTMLNKYFDYMRHDPSIAKTLRELTEFSGIGLKCASCIALYSLDKHACVPIDVHMLHLAQSHYHLNAKHSHRKPSGLTPKQAEEIMAVFEDVFGSYAGWAQMVLFASELKQFKNSTPQQKKSKRQIPEPEIVISSKRPKKNT